MNLTEEIRFDVEDGGIAVVTIDRPQARNAINTGVIEGLRLAWQRFAHDDALRVAILTGSGDKAFCAGMDLKQAAATGCAYRRATCSRCWATPCASTSR
jgi:enoyl-CoA hydratase/carnithine racemase